MANPAFGLVVCEDCGSYAFWDPNDNSGSGERLDFTQWVGGPSGSETPDFPAAPRLVTESETFLFEGVYQGSAHDSKRRITIPIVILDEPDRDGADDIWDSIIAEVDEAITDDGSIGATLRVLHPGSTRPLYYDLLMSSTSTLLFRTAEMKNEWVAGTLLLEAQPYARAESQALTLILP